MCFIGQVRSYEATAESEVDKERKSFLLSRCIQTVQISEPVLNEEQKSINRHAKNGESVTGSSGWISDFNPRSKEETTRNCVTIDNKIKTKVIHTVVDYLLKNASNQKNGVKFDGGIWRKGGELLMGEVVNLFDKELLMELKNECGGLQTLLRNHCHVLQGEIIKKQCSQISKCMI